MGVVRAYWLDRVSYRGCWNLQRAMVEAVRRGELADSLLLLEHPSVFTMGRRGMADHLRWSEAECAHRGVDVVWTDRGGDATYHGPGQLVAYGILDLPHLGTDILSYLRGLEQSLVAYLSTLGIEAAPGGKGLTGVWSRAPGATAPLEKVAAIGVKLNQTVTSHGLALNLTTDLGIFNQGIVPCGLAGRTATSVEALGGPRVSVAEAAHGYAPFFATTFGVELAWADRLELDRLPPPPSEPALGPPLQVV